MTMAHSIYPSADHDGLSLHRYKRLPSLAGQHLTSSYCDRRRIFVQSRGRPCGFGFGDSVPQVTGIVSFTFISIFKIPHSLILGLFLCIVIMVYTTYSALIKKLDLHHLLDPPVPINNQAKLSALPFGRRHRG